MGVALACSLLGPLASACVFDLRERRIPNKLVAGMMLLWCVLNAAALTMACGSMDAWEAVGSGIAGALVLGGGSLVLAWGFERFTGRTSFGGGDVKLLFAMGLYLGVLGGLCCLLVACIAAVALAVVIPRTRFGRVPGSVPGQIPFAPALFAGALVCVLASSGVLG